MIKILESEIQDYLRTFYKRDMTMNIKGIIIAKVEMVNAKCVYDRTIGILTVSNGHLKFEFNISCLYKMEISGDRRRINMFFDNGIDVTIQKDRL